MFLVSFLSFSLIFLVLLISPIVSHAESSHSHHVSLPSSFIPSSVSLLDSGSYWCGCSCCPQPLQSQSCSSIPPFLGLVPGTGCTGDDTHDTPYCLDQCSGGYNAVCQKTSLMAGCFKRDRLVLETARSLELDINSEETIQKEIELAMQEKHQTAVISSYAPAVVSDELAIYRPPYDPTFDTICGCYCGTFSSVTLEGFRSPNFTQLSPYGFPDCKRPCVSLFVSHHCEQGLPVLQSIVGNATVCTMLSKPTAAWFSNISYATDHGTKWTEVKAECDDQGRYVIWDDTKFTNGTQFAVVINFLSPVLEYMITYHQFEVTDTQTDDNGYFRRDQHIFSYVAPAVVMTFTVFCGSNQVDYTSNVNFPNFVELGIIIIPYVEC